MIVMYHKIDIITPTMWWVTPGALARQLSDLRNYDIVYLDDYDPSDPRHVVLTFDDAYENMYRHAYPILKRERVPFEIFVIGDLIGDWNYFDDEEPLTRFASLDHLREMANSGGRIQWHSRTHPKLPELPDNQIEYELTIPNHLRTHFPGPHFRWCAYPYGLHDERTLRVVQCAFAGAVSVCTGDPSDRWRLNRVTVEEDTQFPVNLTE